jgi:hypothetical protein
MHSDSPHHAAMMHNIQGRNFRYSPCARGTMAAVMA